jgi:hypothetical protein
MNPKEKFKDFNQIFLTLKNKIPEELMPVKNSIFPYYTKSLHHNIAICRVKRSKKNTLLDEFKEVILIEKDILSLKDNLSVEAESTSSSKNKIEILTRAPQNKREQETLDLESLQKYFQKLSNQRVDLKRYDEEASTSKGSFRPSFRKPFPPNKLTQHPYLSRLYVTSWSKDHS